MGAYKHGLLQRRSISSRSQRRRILWLDAFGLAFLDCRGFLLSVLLDLFLDCIFKIGGCFFGRSLSLRSRHFGTKIETTWVSQRRQRYMRDVKSKTGGDDRSDEFSRNCMMHDRSKLPSRVASDASSKLRVKRVHFLRTWER